MGKYAVIGLGNFGMAVALELAEQGEHVIALDSDPDKAREAQAYVEEALVTDATDRANLRAVGVDRADVAVVSLGGKMDASTLVVLHLTHLGIPKIVAKALNENHAEILARVGATQVVFPEKEMARRVAERLGSRNVLDHLALTSDISVVELAPPKSFTGKSLAELRLGEMYGVQVLAIKELIPERLVIVPGAAQVIKDSDILVVSGTEDALRRLSGG